MDSLTQIALGSAIGVAVMGRRTALWKAAFWGAVAGTLPDLDAFIDHGDALQNMVRHRAESHSLFYLTLAAPLLAWVVARIHGEGALFKRWWLALWLVLFTHPLLDNMTVYGTQLLQPFTDYPFAIGSIFIIDPIYTLPLIVGVVTALRLRSGKGLRWNALGLVLSSAYLAWSAGAQWHVTQIARASLQQQGIAAQDLLVTPSAFNTVLWRLVATTPTQYFEGHYSLLDASPRVRWTEHERGADLVQLHADNSAIQRIASFTHGFYRVRSVNGRLMLSDLRMGMEPWYTFRFDVGSVSQAGDQPSRPVLRTERPDLGLALPWLWQRLLGRDQPLPAH